MGSLNTRQSFGAEISSGISKDKLNCGWMMSCSIEGLWGVNQTRQETCLRYIQSEVVRQSAIFTIRDHYLSNAHVEREDSR